MSFNPCPPSTPVIQLVAATMTVDSYFWKTASFPELSGVYFNVFQGKSSEWGVCSTHKSSRHLHSFTFFTSDFTVLDVLLPDVTQISSRRITFGVLGVCHGFPHQRGTSTAYCIRWPHEFFGTQGVAIYCLCCSGVQYRCSKGEQMDVRCSFITSTCAFLIYHRNSGSPKENRRHSDSGACSDFGS